MYENEMKFKGIFVLCCVFLAVIVVCVCLLFVMRCCLLGFDLCSQELKNSSIHDVEILVVWLMFIKSFHLLPT